MYVSLRFAPDEPIVPADKYTTIYRRIITRYYLKGLSSWLGEPLFTPLGPDVVFVVLRLNGLRLANFGSGLAGFGCCQLAIFEPKKDPIPPMVDRTSGRDDAVEAVTGVVLSGLACSSLSRSRFVTSDRTPSKARNRLDEPAARAEPIASFVGPN